MLRSMFAAVSGLRSHQTMMDVVGTNISNVNTAGFKSSRTTFQDMMSQVIRGSSGTQADRAGTNPMQIGLGSQVSSIDAVFGQGSIQLTGRTTDLAIQGDGFFIADIGGQRLYTRSGAMNLDSFGTLTGPGGARMQGWMADANGVIDMQGDLTALKVPTGQVISPVRTSEIVLGGNLPATATPYAAGPPITGTYVNTSITVFNEQGVASSLPMQFRNTGPNAWELFTGATSLGTISFNANGTLNATVPSPLVVPAASSPTGADITLNLASPGIELVQYGDRVTAEARSQNGNEMGFLRGFDFGADGSITGRFSNGLTKVLGVIAIATFTNPGGLQRQESMFGETLNSGRPLVGQPGTGDAGQVAPGSLEMSNVDLAQEFTNLIVAQRGFQANARSITASDEMLSDIVNLKR